MLLKQLWRNHSLSSTPPILKCQKTKNVTWSRNPFFSCKLFSPILSQSESSISLSCTRSWAFSRTEPLVWSLPIPSNDSHPVLHRCTWCHGVKSLQICLLSHILPQGVASQTSQNRPEKSLQLSLLFLCSSPSGAGVACSEGEMRQGWTSNAGGLQSQLVTALRTSSGKKEAEEPQSDNLFSSSIALSPLLLSLQTTAPSLELPPKEQAFPIFTTIRAQQVVWTVCFTQDGTTSLHFLKGPGICHTWGLQCTVVALMSHKVVFIADTVFCNTCPL